MGDVINFNSRTNDELIKDLASLLEQAKSGKLESFVSMSKTEDQVEFTLHIGETSILELVGGLEILKTAIFSDDYD